MPATPVPLWRLSFEAPRAKWESVGLMSIWNSFCPPEKAAEDMRTSAPARPWSASGAERLPFP